MQNKALQIMKGFVFEAISILTLISSGPAFRSTPRCVRASLHCGVLASIRATAQRLIFF